MNDPSGNSFVENLCTPNLDPRLKIDYYDRAPNQDMSLGLQPSTKVIEEGHIDNANPEHNFFFQCYI